DFSKDDDLPSHDNEDKVINPGILIYEKSVKIITRVAQEKKLAISYASLSFEDFDPPFFEPLVFKDVPNSMRLLPFSSENEEKVFKPGIYTSKKKEYSSLGCSSVPFLSLLIHSRPATAPATSRYAKAATEAYLRRDHVAAHESFQRLKKNEAANASFHAKGNRAALATTTAASSRHWKDQILKTHCSLLIYESIFEQATHCTPYLRMAKTDMVAASAATFGSGPFLMGLDDFYMQLMSNILAREPLLDAKGACALISSEKSHRAIVIGSGVGTSQRSQSYVFNFGVNNRGNTQRPQTSGNTSRPNNVPRPNNNRNKRATCGPT
nr:ribonuclease H-like domain-containing protein [Tanacetum cinerariifolium]